MFNKTILLRYLLTISLVAASIGDTRGEFENIKIGLTTDEVLKIEGTPTRISKFPRLRQEIWWYKKSSIGFTDGKVSEWYSLEPIKQDKQSTAEIASASTTFTVGSLKQDVLEAQGSPNRISKYERLGEEIWWYGNATVSFKKGAVSEWDNCSELLNVPQNDILPNTPLFHFGSSRDEVMASQGTPRRISNHSQLNEEIWWYGASSITFKGGKVYNWDNYGELNFEMGHQPSDGDEELRGLDQTDGNPVTANDNIHNITSLLDKIHSSFHGLSMMEQAPSSDGEINVLENPPIKGKTSGHTIPDIFKTVISPKLKIPFWEKDKAASQPANKFRGLLIINPSFPGVNNFDELKSQNR